jgi:hypothetical protein
MLDEEVSVLRTSLDEADSSSVSTEVTDRFLKETGFVVCAVVLNPYSPAEYLILHAAYRGQRRGDH